MRTPIASALGCLLVLSLSAMVHLAGGSTPSDQGVPRQPAGQDHLGGVPKETSENLHQPWHQHGDLTPEERTLAVALSMSRFQRTPQSLLALASSLPRLNGQVAPSHEATSANSSENQLRRVMKQLGGAWPFMVDQAIGKSVTPDEEIESDDPDPAVWEPPTNTSALVDVTNTTASGPLIDDKTSNSGDADVSTLTSVSADGDSGMLATQNLAVSLDSVESSRTMISVQFSQIAAYFSTVMQLTRKVGKCKKFIYKSDYQIVKAQLHLKGEDYYHARQKIIFARKGIAICLKELAYRRGDYSTVKAALERADSLCSTTITSLTQLYATDIGQVLPDSALTDLTVEQGGTQVETSGGAYSLKIDANGGAQLRSQSSFSSGTFTATIRCPSGKAAGTNTAFYLSTPPSAGNRYSIIIELSGNDRMRANVNTVTAGVNGFSLISDLGFDCSAMAKPFKISWSPSQIVYYADNKILRVLETHDGSSIFPPGLQMYVYYSMTVTSTVAEGAWSPYVSLPDGPFFTTFSDLKLATPLTRPINIPGQYIRSPVAQIGMDYCSNNMHTTTGEASIAFFNYGCGGRWHSALRYQYGEFSGKFKCAAGDTSGFVSSFYLSSQEGSPDQDEIDFEWLGKDKWGVQTNFYVNGVGGREIHIPLGYDCSEDYHTYTIRYSASSIQWLIDGKLVRKTLASREPAYPSKPVMLYGSIWNASFVNDGSWAGKWNGGRDAPWTVLYQDMRVTSPI